MFDTNRHDEEVAGSKHYVMVAQSDHQPSLEEGEEVIGVVVAVPDELALHLHRHPVISVELPTVHGDQCSSNSVGFCARSTDFVGGGDVAARRVRRPAQGGPRRSGGQRLCGRCDLVRAIGGELFDDAHEVGVLEPGDEERPAIGAPLVGADLVALGFGEATGGGSSTASMSSST